MSDRSHTLPFRREPSPEAGDAERIVSVRAGDTAAYEMLYSRHRKAATAYARHFAAREADVDDLVAEAFANVLDVLRKRTGPTEFFRAYLLRTMQHCAFRDAREQRRSVLTDVWESHNLLEPVRDTTIEAFDNQAVWKAFKRLSAGKQCCGTPKWKVETPAVVAPLLGLRPNSVAALAYRAREGLRIAYTQAHITTMPHEACRKYAAMLGAYTRGKLNPTETGRVREHLEKCEHCKGHHLELVDVCSSMRPVVVLLFLRSAVATHLLRTPGRPTRPGEPLSPSVSPARAIQSPARVASASVRGAQAAGGPDDLAERPDAGPTRYPAAQSGPSVPALLPHQRRRVGAALRPSQHRPPRP
ncbi:zf-HC2 domain-containing protein [Streptomyces sioyaensis]|uniref:zf-HC2 domain-containing protein n=1 Tax=Streptomyces sioyaensis TaxID=67364 RepID=UPI003D747CA5